MTDQEIRYLGDVRKLDLGPNDIIVIQHDDPLSDQTCVAITDTIRRMLGTDNKVLVLGNGLKIGVLSPQE